MTYLEFSNEFDVFYNNVMSNQAPGLDEYEKSVFLTKAQDEVLKNYFNPNGNKYREGFDDSQKRQYDFSNLIRTESLIDISNHIDFYEKFDRRGHSFIFPINCFIPINEAIIDSNNNNFQVLPISYDEYHSKMLKPYQFPVKRLAWRLLIDKKNINYGTINIITKDNIQAPVTILSTYASDKRRLKFNLIKGRNPLNDSYDVSLERVRNNYDLEEINCYVSSADYKLWDADEDYNVLSILRGFKDGDEEIGKVNLNHWDYFKHFDFPSRIKLNDLEIPDSGVVFSLETEVQFVPIAEILGRFASGDLSYKMRYVKIPSPIILENLEGTELSIRNKKSITECELPEELHQEILQRAVELAKAAYTGDLQSSVELGQRSE